jgi:hypothetical protein
MPVSVDDFLDEIAIRNIYKFSSSKLNTTDPHYFIVLKVFESDTIHLVCCTSQFEKRSKFIKERNLPESTLVWIAPDPSNKLNVNSYIDCNTTPYKHAYDEFRQMYLENNIQKTGVLKEFHYEQIITGLKESPMIQEAYKSILPN